MPKSKTSSQTKLLLAKGGLKQEGNTTDPVSGNNVPVGAMQEEVRDDIPAQLSEGEFVFPADVVRFIGLERLMVMRQMAKKGLMQMEEMGQMSNGDEADEEDDIAEFESEIDDIMEGMGEEEEEPREMAVGGMPMPAAAPMQQAPAPETAQAIPTAPAAPAPAMGVASEVEVPTQVESNPTEGLKTSDIIRNNLNADNTPEQTEMFIKQIALLERASKALSIRHNDTVVIGFVKTPGVVDPIVFSENEPEQFDQAINVAMDTFKKAGVNRLESSSPDKMIIEYLTNKGFPVEQGTPESGFTWALDL